MVALLVVGVFAPVVRHEFAGFDDSMCLYWNPHMGRPLGENVAWYWRNSFMHLYVPVIFTVWNVLAAVGHVPQSTGTGGTLNPAVFHGASLVLHAVNAVLVFLLLRRIVRKDWAACAGALLWGLHPLQVEPVAWASGLKDLLCAAFSIVALWQYMVNAQNEIEGRRGVRGYFIACAALLLALLSKPSAVMVPVLVAVIDLLVLGRPTRRVAARVMPLLLIAGVVAVLGRAVQPPHRVPLIGLAWRPLVVTDAVAFYLRKLFMPWNFAVAYGHNPAAARASGELAWTWIIPLSAFVLAWVFRKNRPWVPASLLLFVLAPAPVLGWIRFDYQRISTTADHYLYVAMIGPALLVAGTLAALSAANMRRIATSTCAALLVALAADARHQLGYWRTNLSVWQRAVAIAPACSEAHENLGFAYGDLGPAHNAERVREFATAVQLKPDDLRDHDLYSGALLSVGRVGEAIEQMLIVMRLQEQRDRPGVPLPNERLAAYLSLGDLLVAKGRTDEAAALYRKILRQLPGDPTALHHMIPCIYRLPKEQPPRRMLAGAGE